MNLDDRPIEEIVYGPPGKRTAHICCLCGFKWQSMDKETERAVLKAAKVNKTGPYCDLCYHLEMAVRYSEARGYVSLRDTLKEWLFAGAKKLDEIPDVEGHSTVEGVINTAKIIADHFTPHGYSK